MTTNTQILTKREQDRFSELTTETLRREAEALRLYRPLQSTESFHASDAFERLVRGGNRSSKTTTCAVEFAHAMTGTPIHDCQGNEIPDKYPRNRALIGWVIGFDQKHIGQTIYTKLFKPGAFDIIQDKETGRWRVYRPWEKEDYARRHEVKPAPPLIPERFIDYWAWENRAEGVFSVCHLKNGNRIDAWSSKGEAGQGVAVDVLWVDEDIHIPKNFTEWRTRCIDRDGSKLFWSAWPHTANMALRSFSERAEKATREGNPNVVEWRLRLRDNPYLSVEKRKMVLDGMTDLERRARDFGEFLTDTILVFPRFSVDKQTTDGSGCPLKLKEELEKHNYRPPWDWTHYMSLDPGHTQPAVLMAAIPPPDEFGDFLVVYDEVYIANCDAYDVAEEVAKKTKGIPFEAFLIDGRAGRRTPEGFARTIQEQYSMAWKHFRLKSRVTGSGFMHGSDDPGARNMMVRRMMEPKNEKTDDTQLILVTHQTLNLQDEFGLYSKTITKDQIKDKVKDAHNHLCDALAYLVSYSPTYQLPRKKDRPKNPHVEYIKKIKNKQRRPNDGVFFMGAGERPY